MGKSINLITPHACYLSLGKTNKERQFAYKGLFDQQIPNYTLQEICNALNKAWVLGEDRF